MKSYQESIFNKSVWFSTTPSELSRKMPFYYSEAGHFYGKQDYLTKRDYHDSHLFLYTLQGEGFIETNSYQGTLSARQAILIDCRLPHCYQAHNGMWEFVWIHLHGYGLEAYDCLLSDSANHPINIEDPSLVLSKMPYFLQAQSYHREAVSNTSFAIHELLNLLCQQAFSSGNERPEAPLTDHISLARDYLEKHFSEEITLDTLLAHIPVSKYHFIRSFKEKLGLTPYQYLTQIRIQHAKILLRQSDLPVSSIADQCGYTDTSNFIAHFKKLSGETPLQYRKNFSSFFPFL